MMTDKKPANSKKGFLFIFLSAVFIISCFMIANPVEVEAASSYKAISFEEDSYNDPIKVNGYYFKYNSKYKLCISKKKSSGYKSTKIGSFDAWTNGKTIYYTKNGSSIYKYTISSKKSKKVKSLSSVLGKDGYAYIRKIYKNRIYFTVDSEQKWSVTTYFYNTKTKKIKKVKSNADIMASSGKYCVCQKEKTSEISTVTLTLYKITSSGKFKKIKKLTSQGDSYVKAISGKFYYVRYSDKYSFTKASVYRIKTNGNSKKKMITVSEDYMISPCRLFADSCSFSYYDDDNDEVVTKYYY